MPLTPQTFSRFGGLRLDLPISQVSAEEAIALLDVDWADRNPGMLRPRSGASALKVEEATSLYSALARSTPLRLLALKNDAKKKLAAVDEDGTEVAETEWPVQVACSFVNFGTPSAVSVYALRGSTAVIKFDGNVGFSTPTASLNGVAGKTMPPLRYAAAWAGGGNRLVGSLSGGSWEGAGIGGESHVVFSDPGDAESWHTTPPEANYVQLTPGDNESITCICEWNDQIFVTKESRLFVFYSADTDNEGSPVFNYRIVELGTRILNPMDVGVNAKPSSDAVMVAGDEGVYILTENGIMLTTGGAPVLISQELSALESEAAVEGPMGALLGGVERWSDCRGLVFHNRRLYVIGGEPEAPGGRTFIYDIDRQAWLVWTAAMSAMVSWEAGGTEKKLCFSGKAAKSIFLYGENVLTDPASPMTPSWQSGFYNLGTDDEKALTQAKLWGSGEVNVAVAKDFGEVGKDKTFVLGVAPEVKSAQHQRTQNGVLHSHRFSGEGSWRVQRFTRYLQEDRVPDAQTR